MEAGHEEVVDELGSVSNMARTVRSNLNTMGISDRAGHSTSPLWDRNPGPIHLRQGTHLVEEKKETRWGQ